MMAHVLFGDLISFKNSKKWVLENDPCDEWVFGENISKNYFKKSHKAQPI